MLRGNHKKQNFAQAAFQSCLLFLLVFFGSSPISAHAIPIILQDRSFVDIKEILTADFFISADHLAENPYDSNSAPEESEQHGETDEENFDDDNKLLFWIHSPDYAISFSIFLSNHFYRLTRAHQNQASLPLYVLFHSWKSYLL